MTILAKICLLGDGEVGKTSLIHRYLGKGFSSEYTPTLGSDFLSKQVSLDTKYGPKELRFQIWDLAGQPAFDQIRKLYYKGSGGAFIVFDLTRPKLERMERWLKEFAKNIQSKSSTIIVIGNKVDLKDEIKVSTETVNRYIDKHLVNKFSNVEVHMKYFTTSAKTGSNVDQAFASLGEMIIEKIYQ